MVPESRDEGMPVVQVEVHGLAEPAQRADDGEHMRQSASHRVLNVCHQAGQPVVHRAELLEIQAGMAAFEAGGRLPQADVADIDAAADPLGRLEPLRHLDEPATIQSGGVLEEKEGTARALTKMGIQLTHRGQQTIGLGRHLTFVVDHQASDAAREAVGEFPDQGAVPPVQHVDAPAQVNHGQAFVGRHERQDVLEAVRCVGVHLRRDAHLGEAEPGQLEQRVVPVDTLLEQGVDGTPPGTVHDLGGPRELFHRRGEAVGCARHCPP